MRTYAGLSLTEVLVTLVFVCSASLALLKQQWHVGQFLHQCTLDEENLLQQTNAAERDIATHHALF